MRSYRRDIMNFYEILIFFGFILTGSTEFMEKTFPAAVLEDATLDTPHLLMKYNYPAEIHYTTTKDNYILCLHRIARPQAQPVFLMHGFEDSSATWIFMGPWSSLGYYLYDQGYDVWMGNARGNRYSRNHTTLNPNSDVSFWKFSWHEIGIYDLPAMIDFVLQHTQKKKLTYFGHSQGTTSFFVMCAQRPAYNLKINSMHALAPVAFMKHMRTPLLALVQNLMGLFDGFPEFFPHSNLFFRNCLRSKVTLDTCTEVFFQLLGKDVKQTNATMWPVIFGHLPAGSALKQVKHYIQLKESDRFCQYDYGATENLKRYGKSSPPDYTLQNVTAPIGLYYTYNDYLTSENDVKRLARLLPNVIENNLMPYKKWNHGTVVWGIEARKLLHEGILSIIKKYE